MNWDYWRARHEEQQKAKEKIKMTPLEKSGLKVIDWGNSGVYKSKNPYSLPKSYGETCNTKMMKFLNKTGLVQDVDFQMVN